MNPMIPFLTGWLAGTVGNEGAKAMKIVCVEPDPPSGFTVSFASGAKVRVHVTEVPKTRGAEAVQA